MPDDFPSESTDAINKLSTELADLAKTDPEKTACAGISVLEGIVSGVTEAATKLSSEAQAVADKALKPIEAGLSEVTNQKDYKSNCAGSAADATLPNQSALISQFLKPIVGGWSSQTLICDVLMGLFQTFFSISLIAFMIASVISEKAQLMPLAIAVFFLGVVPTFWAGVIVLTIYNDLGCDAAGNEMQSKVPTLDAEELLRLAKKANSK